MRKGSALLVVLGMLAFMVVSATAFSIYMRQNRMPSSFLRQRSAASMLVKAALAEAMHEIDVAIGGDPYPNEYVKTSNGLLFNVQSRDEKRSDETEIYNTWRNRVYIGTRSLSGSEDDGIDEKNTVSVLNLEGLAYLPPPLVNTVRYWARRSESARWQTLDFDSGRYAFTAVNVSDYLDINRLVADRMRDSSPSNRITLAYRFGNNTSRMQAFDTAINAFKTDTDYGRLVSLADYNMAMGDKSGKVKSPKKGSLDYVSPFMSYITGNAAAGFYDNVTEADAAEQTFVTDSWYPYAATNANEIVLSDFINDDFVTKASANAAKGYSGKRATLDDLQRSATAMTPLDRIQKRLSLVTLGALADYIDEDDVPISLAIPTAERTPMLTGVQIDLNNFKFSFKQTRTTEPDSTNPNATIYHYNWAYNGVDGTFVVNLSAVFPFKRKSDITPGSYTAQVVVKGFLTDAPQDFAKLRLSADLRPSVDEWSGTKEVSVEEEGYFYAQGTITTPVKTDIDLSNVPMSLKVKPAQDLKVFAYKVTETRDDSGSTTRSDPEDDPDYMGTKPFAYIGGNGRPRPVNVKSITDPTAKLTLTFLAWVRIIDGNGNTVDLAPATFDDDKNLNDIDHKLAESTAAKMCGSGNPVFPIASENALEMTTATFVDSAASVETTIGTPTSSFAAYCNDPRYNFAPEDWYVPANADGGINAQGWRTGVSGVNNQDIFQFVSNRGYLQSIGEIQFLPYTGDFGSGANFNPISSTYYANPGKYDGENKTTLPTAVANLANRDYMWQTYWAFGPDRDKVNDMYKWEIADTRGGVSIPPYTASDELFLAGLDGTPYDWIVADTLNGYKADKIPTLTFNENNSEARITEEQLKTIAKNMRSAFKSGTEYAEWNEWNPDKSDFFGATLSDFHDVDRKFLFSYWKNCYANNQQLFLVFVRAEPTMMTGEAGSDRTPSQLGARAMALVWRDPASSLTAHGGGQHPPHTMRILFYHQFE